MGLDDIRVTMQVDTSALRRTLETIAPPALIPLDADLRRFGAAIANAYLAYIDLVSNPPHDQAARVAAAYDSGGYHAAAAAVAGYARDVRARLWSFDRALRPNRFIMARKLRKAFQ